MLVLQGAAGLWTSGRSGHQHMSPAHRCSAAPGLGSALPHTSKAIYLDYNGTTPIFPEVHACSCSRVCVQSELDLVTR